MSKEQLVIACAIAYDWAKGEVDHALEMVALYFPGFELGDILVLVGGEDKC